MAIQRLQLPVTVEGHGGLSFDGHGQFVSGPMTILPVTFSRSYSAFIRDQLRAHPKDADEHGILTDDLREKMEVLLRSQLVDDLDRHVETLQRTLVPAGLGLGDVLIDPQSLQLTALLDFDFAWVGSKLDSSLSIIDLDRRWLGPEDDEGHATKGAIKRAVLTGNWQLGVESTGAGQVAKMWYEALEEEGAMIRNSMTGVEVLSLLRDLGEELSPVVIRNEIVVTGRTDQQRKNDTNSAGGAIRRVLDILLGMRDRATFGYIDKKVFRC